MPQLRAFRFVMSDGSVEVVFATSRPAAQRKLHALLNL